MRSFTVFLVLLSSLLVPACKEGGPGAATAELAAAASGSPANAAAAQALDKKLSDAIYCINVTSPGVQRASKSYTEAVDPVAGPEPKGRIYVERLEPKHCIEQVTKALALKPAVPDLDAAITAYIAQVNALMPTVNAAADYYEQKRHLDDGAAKGKELHPALVAGFAAFATADRELRSVVEKHNRAATEAELARLAAEPAQRGRFLRTQMLLLAEDLIKMSDVPELAALDATAFTAKTTELDKALTELTTFAEADKDGGSLLRLARDTRPYLKAALAIVRRVRDNQPYTESELGDLASNRGAHVEGSFSQLIAEYNDMIRTANSPI